MCVCVCVCVYVCVGVGVWISEKQPLLPCTTVTDWFSVTKVGDVYCAVCTESLYRTKTFHLQEVSRTYRIHSTVNV
jgi:hypothetical protein